MAHVIDHAALSGAALLLGFMMLGATYWFGAVTGTGGGAFFGKYDPLVLQLLLAGGYVLLAVPYYIIGVYYYGTTIGKRPFRLYVVDERTLGPLSLRQAVIRCLAYALSWVLWLGYLLAAFHPRKRALHDLIAGTVVIVKPPRTRWLAPILCCAVLALPMQGYAGDSAPGRGSRAPWAAVELQGAWLNGTLFGGGWQTSGALLVSSRGFTALSAGPRLSLGKVSVNGFERTDLAVGIQGTVWFLNAFGIGLGIDEVFSNSTSPFIPDGGGSGRLVFEPAVSARFLRFGETGAWAAKFGGQYDTFYKWSIKLGVTLQLSGVSNLSQAVSEE